MNRRDALKRTAAITGFAISSSVGAGFLSGCQPTGDPGWEPVFLNKDQVKLVTSIIDVILPKTSTPGAIELHVPEFLDLMLFDNFDSEGQDLFRRGIEDFDKKVRKNYPDGFDHCNQSVKENIIAEEEEESRISYSQTYQKSFYLSLKEISLLGYFSSEYVMRNLLNYNPVAGRYEGCIPFSEEDRLYVDDNV